MTSKKIPLKKTTVTTVESDQPEIDPFEAALEEFGGADELSLQIYRYREDEPGTPAYVKKIQFNPEFHSLEWIRKQFGPGRYQLRFYARAADGRQSRNVTVAIDPETLPASSAPPAPAGNAELVSVLREQNQLFLTSLLTRKDSGIDSATVLLKLLEGNQTVNAELLRHTLSSRAGGGDTMGSVLSAVEKFFELTEQHKVESEGGILGTVRAIAKDLAPIFREMAQARAAVGPFIPMITPGAPPAAAPPGAPPAITTSPSVELGSAGVAGPRAGNGDPKLAAIEQIVRLSADEILKANRRGDKPEEVSDWILGEVPPNYYDVFEGLTVEKLVSIDPRYQELDRSWLERILEELHGAATIEDEEPKGTA